MVFDRFIPVLPPHSFLALSLAFTITLTKLFCLSGKLERRVGHGPLAKPLRNRLSSQTNETDDYPVPPPQFLCLTTFPSTTHHRLSPLVTR